MGMSSSDIVAILPGPLRRGLHPSRRLLLGWVLLLVALGGAARLFPSLREHAGVSGRVSSGHRSGWGEQVYSARIAGASVELSVKDSSEGATYRLEGPGGAAFATVPAEATDELSVFAREGGELLFALHFDPANRQVAASRPGSPGAVISIGKDLRVEQGAGVLAWRIKLKGVDSGFSVYDSSGNRLFRGKWKKGAYRIRDGGGSELARVHTTLGAAELGAMLLPAPPEVRLATYLAVHRFGEPEAAPETEPDDAN
jgi:hypothetical protein